MGACASAAGAKDAGAFLNSSFSSHNKGLLSFPSFSSLTHEGVYYQHYFAIPPTSDEVLRVTCSAVAHPDPLSHEIDRFLCLGVSSKFDGPGLRHHGGRPPVQLVYALDVSGSMGSTFPNLSSKALRQGPEVAKVVSPMSKLEAAKYALIEMLDYFKDGDSFGLVTFNTSAKTVIPLSKWNAENKEGIIAKIKKVSLGGGTDLTCGFVKAADELKSFEQSLDSPTPPLRWVFYLTDMVMTCGNSQELLRRVSAATSLSSPIYTQIIGFGFDFNVEFAATMARIPLLSYFSVNSAEEFVEQMTWEFDYLVFPIATNFQVSLLSDSSACAVEAVCGSTTPLEEYPPGTLMVSSGCFASQTQGRNKDETKGGVVLVKIRPEDPSVPLTLQVKYTTYEGKEVVVRESVSFPSSSVSLSDSERKGILLARFVAIMRAFLKDTESLARSKEVEDWNLFPNKSIPFVLKEDGASNIIKASAYMDEGSKAHIHELIEALEVFLIHFDSESAQLQDVGMAVWRAKIAEFLSSLREIVKEPELETTPAPDLAPASELPASAPEQNSN